MATSFTGSLGQTNDGSSITDLITQWPTAAQNQVPTWFGAAYTGYAEQFHHQLFKSGAWH
ncbi:hypothetical protein [Microcoleus sp. herbarium2]|uniref:hypothetical protein n=1 Tax=Microcoleus sp. herbarium2 TaxID=3055433 RepID=UPI002FD36706